MTEHPTGEQRIAAAYAKGSDLAALKRVAATHDPAHDDEADHIAGQPDAPPTARLAAAYQRTQRAAAKQVANHKEDR